MSRVETAICARCTGRRRPLRGAAHRRAGQTGDAGDRRTVRAEPGGVLARHARAGPSGESDGRGDAGRHVLRPRHHPCAHHGDAQPATRALPAGPLRGQAFRPNIAVRPDNDDAQFVETSWVERELRIGDDVVLEITDHCPRCVMTTLPHGDLLKDSGILRTAARHNEAHVGVYGKGASHRESPARRHRDPRLSTNRAVGQLFT